MKSKSVTIQMKATEEYFPVVLFILQYKVVLIFELVKIKYQSVTIRMKAIEQYCPLNKSLLEEISSIMKKYHSYNDPQYLLKYRAILRFIICSASCCSRASLSAFSSSKTSQARFFSSPKTPSSTKDRQIFLEAFSVAIFRSSSRTSLKQTNKLTT